MLPKMTLNEGQLLKAKEVKGKTTTSLDPMGVTHCREVYGALAGVDGQAGVWRAVGSRRRSLKRHEPPRSRRDREAPTRPSTPLEVMTAAADEAMALMVTPALMSGNLFDKDGSRSWSALRRPPQRSLMVAPVCSSRSIRWTRRKRRRRHDRLAPPAKSGPRPLPRPFHDHYGPTKDCRDFMEGSRRAGPDAIQCPRCWRPATRTDCARCVGVIRRGGSRCPLRQAEGRQVTRRTVGLCRARSSVRTGFLWDGPY